MKIKFFSLFLFLFMAIPAWLVMSTMPAVCEPMYENELAHPSGVVAQCFDGDTMKLTDRRIVRLAGIDAPEVPHRGTKAQYYSRQAREAITAMSKGKTVTLAFPSIRQHDNYGRLVAEVFLDNGESLNEKLVESGAAFFYPHRDLHPEFQEKLRLLQADAINARRGLWEYLLSLPLAQETYIGNRQSMRFFPATCPETQNIKPRNRVTFGTLMDAFLAGYAPARICIFWPEEK